MLHMPCLKSSKAWIRIQAPYFIPMILAVQVIAALSLDLRKFHDLLIFNLATVAAPLPIYALDACCGMRKRLKEQSSHAGGIGGNE